MTNKHYEHPDLAGCSDGGCIIKRPAGMHTNGGCQCEKELRRAPKGFDAVRTIHFLRAELRARDQAATEATASQRELADIQAKVEAVTTTEQPSDGRVSTLPVMKAITRIMAERDGLQNHLVAVREQLERLAAEAEENGLCTSAAVAAKQTLIDTEQASEEAMARIKLEAVKAFGRGAQRIGEARIVEIVRRNMPTVGQGYAEEVMGRFYALPCGFSNNFDALEVVDELITTCLEMGKNRGPTSGKK